MSYTTLKALPTLAQLRQAHPLTDALQQRIHQDRHDIQAIIDGRDTRLLIIIGPCSAWPKEAVLEYAQRLAALNQRVCHRLKIVMRVYSQKPRTTQGWAGALHHPQPWDQPDIAAGMYYVRDMMIRVLEQGLAIADEVLTPHSSAACVELLAWAAIGARSTENREHRVFASALDCPVGLKNPTQGSLVTAVNSIVAAQHPHVAALSGYEVQTHGNAYAHLVLRGSTEGPNYSLAHLKQAQHLLQLRKIQHPALLIDTSHDNCRVNGKKDPLLQPIIVRDTLASIQQDPGLQSLVKGFMIESFLKSGRQSVELNTTLDKEGLSITDPCIGWNETEQLLLELAGATPFKK